MEAFMALSNTQLGTLLAFSIGTLVGLIAGKVLWHTLWLGDQPKQSDAEPFPRVCRRCGQRFSGEAMLYCLTENPLCSNAIWSEPGVRAQGPDWHLRGRQQ